MVPDFIGQVFGKYADALWGFLPSTIGFAIVFAALTPFSSQACNPGRPWWRNPGLVTDFSYMVILPFITPYLRISLMIIGAALLSGVMTAQQVADYFDQGNGPLAGLPFWGQVAIYVVMSDFMLYWAHRVFHGGTFWRFHAVHHSAEEIDWTTAYRFHFVNLWLGPSLATVTMLYLGIAPTVLILLVPLDNITAAFVHANLKWTLGPLKYLVATPVFHRWHHTPLDQGGNTNFGSLLSVWDVLFGTFYMPAGQLPTRYGLDDPAFPQDFIGQFVHPFRDMIEGGHRPDAVTSPPPAP